MTFTHDNLVVGVVDDDLQYKVRARTEAGYSPFSIRNTFSLAALPTVSNAPLKTASSA